MDCKITLLEIGRSVHLKNPVYDAKAESHLGRHTLSIDKYSLAIKNKYNQCEKNRTQFYKNNFYDHCIGIAGKSMYSHNNNFNSANTDRT